MPDLSTVMLIFAIVIFAAVAVVIIYVSITSSSGPPGPPGPPGPTPGPTYAGKENISSMFSPASDLGHGSQICSLSQSTSSKHYTSCKLIGSAPPTSFTKAELQVELKLIALVTKARKADTKSPSGQQLSNPYKIRYSVYNMMLTAAVAPIKAALAAGVYVQILIEQSQTSPCLRGGDKRICGHGAGCYNQAIPELMEAFSASSSSKIFTPTWGKEACCGGTCCTCNGTNEPACCKGSLSGSTPGGSFGSPNLYQIKKSDSGAKLILQNGSPNQWAAKSESQLIQAGLLPILTVSCNKGYAGIMHTKMRVFEWLDSSGGKHATVMSGSLNPDPSAVSNDETLFRIDDSPICNDYIDVYNSVLHLSSNPDHAQYTYQNPKLDLDNQKIQLYFSKGNVSGSPGNYKEDTTKNIGVNITDLIAKEKELVMVFVYTITDFGTLVPALQQAAENGAFIFVITDLDQVVGEAGFSQPNRTCLMTEINSIQLDKKYRLDGETSYVPVYVAKNNNGAHNAFHHKNVLLGIDVMKVITDTSNWTRAAVGGSYGSFKPNGAAGSITNASGSPCSGCGCAGDQHIKCGSDPKNRLVSKYCSPAGPTSACSRKSTFSASLAEPTHLVSTLENYNDPCSSGWGNGNGNCVSSVANCDTTLFINSKLLDNNATGMAFAEVCIYLIEKYWVFTMSSIAEIYHPGQKNRKVPYYKGSMGPEAVMYDFLCSIARSNRM